MTVKSHKDPQSCGRFLARFCTGIKTLSNCNESAVLGLETLKPRFFRCVFSSFMPAIPLQQSVFPFIVFQQARSRRAGVYTPPGIPQSLHQILKRIGIIPFLPALRRFKISGLGIAFRVRRLYGIPGGKGKYGIVPVPGAGHLAPDNLEVLRFIPASRNPV